MVHVDPLFVFEAIHYFFETESLLEFEASDISGFAFVFRGVKIRESFTYDGLKWVNGTPMCLRVGRWNDGRVSLIEGVHTPHSSLLFRIIRRLALENVMLKLSGLEEVLLRDG